MRVKIGVIADIHIAPSGIDPVTWHNELRFEDAAVRFDMALEACANWADFIVVLGDLTHLGDEASLVRAVTAAATKANCPVLLVLGNHDAIASAACLPELVKQHGRGIVQMASPIGELVAPGVRVAGLPIDTRDGGFSAYATALPRTDSWGTDTVVWLTHYPVISRAAVADEAGLRYAGDLDALHVSSSALLDRLAPTIALCGHLHIRDHWHDSSLLQIASASLIEPPFEFALLELATGNGEIRADVWHETVAPSPQATLPVLAPDSSAWRFAHGTWSEATT